MWAVQTSKSPAELSFSALPWRILQSGMKMQQDCSGMLAMHMWGLNIHFTRKTDILYFKCISSTWQQFQCIQTVGQASYAYTRDRTAFRHAQTFPCTRSAFRAESPSGGWLSSSIFPKRMISFHLSPNQSLTSLSFPTLSPCILGILLCALFYPPVFQQLLTRPCCSHPFSWIRSLCFHSSLIFLSFFWIVMCGISCLPTLKLNQENFKKRLWAAF